MTRIQKGRQAGELWDRVVLPNGIVGYVFQSYLKEVPTVQIEQIRLSASRTVINKGESETLQVEILPLDAKDHEVEYSSSNPNILSVDGEGNLLAIQSGIADIKVKAKENSVASSMRFQVYTPLTDMQINAESLVMKEQDRFVILPVFTPSDADNQKVIYTTDNEEVATVDSDGTITARKEGSTKIIVKTEEANITREILVTVVSKLGEDEIIFDEGLQVEQNVVSGWKLEDLTVASVKDKIQTSYIIKIYNNKNQELTEEKQVGTGSKIQLVNEQNVIKMEYYVIIYGDVNGDGKINSTDLLVLQRHILEIQPLKGLYLKAGNINKNGKNPSSLDSLLIQRHILGLKLIEQKIETKSKDAEAVVIEKEEEREDETENQ